MSLETIALIGVLTLLTVSLGTDFFWIVVMKPAFQRISDSSLLEAIGNIHIQAATFMPVIFLTTLVCAVILNVGASSRSEPYLLRIGLMSLAVYYALVFIGSVPINHTIVSMLNGAELEPSIRELQNQWNVILWFRLLSVLISYWSFLHYALNPKVKSFE
jgi:uncharacterized membrane protein